MGVRCRVATNGRYTWWMGFQKPKRPLERAQKQQLVDGLIEAGLQQHADALLAPTVWIDLERTEDAFAIGANRFGGLPDLPAATEWPAVDGNPLFFVGQFDLAGLAGFAAAKDLPATGLLSFFLLDRPRGDQHHCGAGVVLHTPAGAALVRVSSGQTDTRLSPGSRLSFPKARTCSVQSASVAVAPALHG